MTRSGSGANRGPAPPPLLAYLADLELEVDRLRKQSQFVQQNVRETLLSVQRLCAGRDGPGDTLPALAEIDRQVKQLAGLLQDLRDPAGYHPAHDQAVAIAVRPLAEQVFRSEQRLMGAPQVVLRLELECDYVEWFPARLRHILANLLATALKYRDADKEEAWVRLGLRVSPQAYEFRVSDNGTGLPAGGRGEVLEIFHRAAPARAAGLGVGLAVVKFLVEQSGGSFAMDPGAGQGSTFVAVLPRYDVDDYLT